MYRAKITSEIEKRHFILLKLKFLFHILKVINQSRFCFLSKKTEVVQLGKLVPHFVIVAEFDHVNENCTQNATHCDIARQVIEDFILIFIMRSVI